MKGKGILPARCVGSSLGELPDQNGPWGWVDWRGSTGADEDELGPKKPEVVSLVPVRVEPERVTEKFGHTWEPAGTCG